MTLPFLFRRPTGRNNADAVTIHLGMQDGQQATRRIETDDDGTFLILASGRQQPEEWVEEHPCCPLERHPVMLARVSQSLLHVPDDSHAAQIVVNVDGAILGNVLMIPIRFADAEYAACGRDGTSRSQ